VQRYGTQATLLGGLATAALGLPLLVTPSLVAVLSGMVLVGVGTFFAQATATGFVGRAGALPAACISPPTSPAGSSAARSWARPSHLGWVSCVIGVGLSLLAAASLALKLRMRPVMRPVTALA
jgi:hypothetical protein